MRQPENASNSRPRGRRIEIGEGAEAWRENDERGGISEEAGIISPMLRDLQIAHDTTRFTITFARSNPR